MTVRFFRLFSTKLEVFQINLFGAQGVLDEMFHLDDSRRNLEDTLPVTNTSRP